MSLPYKIFALTLSLAFFSANIVSAQQTSPHKYLYIATTSNAAAFIDTISLYRSKGSVSVWVLWVYGAPQSLPYGKSFVRQVARVTYACEPRTMKLWSFFDYDTDEQVVKSQVNEPPETTPVPPDSIGEEMLDAACSPTYAGHSVALSLSTAIKLGKAEVHGQAAATH